MREQCPSKAPVSLILTPLFLFLTHTLVDRSLFQKTDELGPKEVKPMCGLGSDSWNPNVQMKPGNTGCDELLRRDKQL